MNKATLKLEFDGDLECPNDFECNWRLHSFSRRHNSYTDVDNFVRAEYTEEPTGRTRTRFTGVLGIDGNEILVQEPIMRDNRTLHPIDDELAAKLESGLAFFLSYYEHGGCAWSLSDEGMQCDFDSVSMAGILVWPHPEDEIGAKSLSDRAEDARGFLKEYNAWANGDGYGYSIEDGDGEDIDSCWGFYGDDYMLNDNIVPALKTFMDENSLTKIEILSKNSDDNNDPATLYLAVNGEASYLLDNIELIPLTSK